MSMPHFRRSVAGLPLRLPAHNAITDRVHLTGSCRDYRAQHLGLIDNRTRSPRPALLWSEPTWLRGERGPDVSGDMTWIPVVTFWQVAADMAFAMDVPAGHGHR
jgi:hypothetical protein